MTLPELENQVLQLPTGDRWQLVQIILESLKRESRPILKQGNLSRLQGIAKNLPQRGESDANEDYITYLTQKYQ